MYAEGVVDVESKQLTARCSLGTPLWFSSAGDLLLGGTFLPDGVTAELDNDGNADVTFQG